MTALLRTQLAIISGFCPRVESSHLASLAHCDIEFGHVASLSKPEFSETQYIVFNMVAIILFSISIISRFLASLLRAQSFRTQIYHD